MATQTVKRTTTTKKTTTRKVVVPQKPNFGPSRCPTCGKFMGGGKK